jgi:protoporphyrinogen oxidase
MPIEGRKAAGKGPAAADGSVHLVVGLGMSGIGAVRTLHEAGQNWLGVEAQGAPGGWSQSWHVSGYRLDYGPHIMLDFDDDLRRWMALDADLSFREHRSNSVFFCDIEGRAVPVHLPLGDNIAALPPVALPEFEGKDHPTYLSYLVESFGAEVAARFLIPYDRKRLCVDLDTLPPKWNHRVLPAGKAKVGESSYLYPVDVGVGALSQHLLQGLDQNRLRYRTRLLRVSLEKKTAWFSDGSSVQFASLYSSLPLPEFLNLIDDQPFDPIETRAALPYARTGLSYLALRSPWTQDYDFARFASPHVAFHRLTVLSAYSENCCPPHETLLMLEANSAPGPHSAVTTPPLAAVQQLIDLGMFSPGTELAFSHTARVEHSAIFMNDKTPEFLSRANDILAASGVHLIGKFGRWEDMLMGRALQSGIRAAQAQVSDSQPLRRSR